MSATIKIFVNRVTTAQCVFFLGAVLLFSGCADGRYEAAALLDAASQRDANIGVFDAAQRPDRIVLTMPDGQVGTIPDGAVTTTPDASTPDANPADSALSDASIPDGSAADADLPDANLPDASNQPDGAVPIAVAPSALVINEIEVNNPGDDLEEFVEVLNRSGAPVALAGVDLVHINGASGNGELGRWDLSTATRSDGTPVTMLASGEILVLAQQGSTVLANLPAGTARLVHTTALQNGPDVLQIEDGFSTVIDSVAYQDEIPGFGEGKATQGDLGDARGLSRCPRGSDTNDNRDDFERAALTPAEPNTCSAP